MIAPQVLPSLVRLPPLPWALILLAALTGVAGCDYAPGRPGPEPEVPRPEAVLDFPTLYKQNCAACHGANGSDGAAISLNNPVYLTVAGEGAIRSVIANGTGTLMPPFAKSSGGMLTDQQVTALAHGMTTAWGKPNLLDGQNAPSYATTLKGNAGAGQAAFETFCSKCHGASASGRQGNGAHSSKAGPIAGSTAGSITDPSYLALISDQDLRSIIIAGSPQQDMPDWRTDAATPMTDQEITNIVAWLGSKRTAFPGQPYPQHP